MRKSFAIGIGGAAGQGVATPGDIFCKIFSRRGLHLNAYNAYQSIIRGGHTFLTVRTGPDRRSRPAIFLSGLDNREEHHKLMIEDSTMLLSSSSRPNISN